MWVFIASFLNHPGQIEHLITIIPAPSMVAKAQVSGHSDQGQPVYDGNAALCPHEDTSTDE
jgi:hypothetical protein